MGFFKRFTGQKKPGIYKSTRKKLVDLNRCFGRADLGMDCHVIVDLLFYVTTHSYLFGVGGFLRDGRRSQSSNSGNGWD